VVSVIFKVPVKGVSVIAEAAENTVAPLPIRK
jgi:hypothetical protein